MDEIEQAKCHGCKARPAEVAAFWPTAAPVQVLAAPPRQHVQLLHLCRTCAGVISGLARELHLTPGVLQILPLRPVAEADWQVIRAD